MDTKIAKNHTFKRTIGIALSIVIILAITFSVTGAAFADESLPNPFIAVSLTEHWFWVNNFTPETLVTFYVYDSKGDEDTILEYIGNTDEFGNLIVEGWKHLWNPEPGDYIVATDGSITKDLVLEYITLDEFDYENDFLAGEAAYPGRSVDLGVGNENGEQWMNVTAGIDSRWNADFKIPEYKFDITEDSWAGAHVNDDDGDVTAAHNSSGPPEPPAWFTAFPEQDVVEAWDFPLGAVVHMAIDDPMTEGSPDYEQNETVVFAPWGSWQLWVWFEFPGEYNLKPGDVVTLNDGITERTHVVRDLSITGINAERNTVIGVSAGKENISLWAWDDPQANLLQTTANNSGLWRADFDDVGLDLLPDNHVRAEIWDESGNDTAVDWYVHPSYTGHWRAIDSYDESNMQMTISGISNNQYHLAWTDDYWSICDGRGGIGLGTGYLDSGGSLRVDWVIKCRGVVTLESELNYWLDLETGTLWEGDNAWYPVGGR